MTCHPGVSQITNKLSTEKCFFSAYNDYERNGLSYEKNNRDSGQF